MHSIDQAKDIQVVVKGQIGSGKGVISAIIANALKDTLPHCDITMLLDGKPMSLDAVKDMTERVRATDPSVFYAFNVEIDTREIPEM